MRHERGSCGTDRTIDLTREFHRSHLHVRTRVTVVIIQPQWIGKYYESSRAPAIRRRAARLPSL